MSDSFTSASLLHERLKKAQRDLGHMAGPPETYGPLTFPPSGNGCWSVYDMGENHCGSVYMHGKKAWYEPSGIRQPLCVHELRELLLFMECREMEAK